MTLIPRFPVWGRYLMLGSGVTVALLNAILRGGAPDGGWIAALFVPLGVVALGWFAMVGIAQDQPFESLDPQERLEALGLAWDRAPFVPTALTGAVLVAYLTVGLAGIWRQTQPGVLTGMGNVLRSGRWPAVCGSSSESHPRRPRTTRASAHVRYAR